MINIIIVKLNDKTYNAFGVRDGYPLGTTLRLEKKLTKREIENIISVRFCSQVIKARSMGVDVETRNTKGIYYFQWVSLESVDNWINNIPPILGMSKTPSKPKLYEIQSNPNGGLTLIKHEKELLDEDEAKIRLFEAAVNS